MKRRTRNHAPPSPWPRRSLWLGVLGLFALALALVTAWPEEQGAATATPRPAAAERRGTYSNRSLWRPPRAARAEPAATPPIKGTVYDAEGRPLQGATVTASTFEVAGNIPTPVMRAKTDEMGHFDLTLPDGTYQLRAEMEGHGPASATSRTGDTVGLILPPNASITGRVLDERGEPVTRFSIDVLVSMPGDMPASPPVFSRRFDSPDGSFRVDGLPVWSVVVRASADDLAPAYSDDIHVAPGDTAEVDLRLTRGCVLSGKVVNASGDPAPGVLVDAEARVGAGALGDISFATSDEAETDQGGAFRLARVPTGSVLVRAYDGASAVTTTAVEITDCADVAPIQLVVSRGGSLTGVARDADGGPLAGARLTLMHRSIGFVNALSDERGRYRFDRIPAGPARLELNAGPRTAQRFATVEDGAETEQDIALHPEGNGEIYGRVVAGGHPLAGVQLLVAAGHGQSLGIDAYTPVTGQDGTFRVDGLPEGIYIVNVVSTSVSRGVRLEAGASQEVDLDLSMQLAARRDGPPAGAE